ncbi:MULTISPECIES: DUF7555 family protein [Halolamina]|uniref:Uncharacterized protein n=1 Tax=Halolamina pelagica TaxID=699431 RepID=A0A1I5MM55_9EURY|nr:MULTISPECIES: hypothetical protein [Halolamina]NHX36082.1 hypothetical protein [Halolamina sp. R1-12]SFP10590.1 hypothetical protein SAMN05216277_101326 [Halolamina pelagica]
MADDWRPPGSPPGDRGVRFRLRQAVDALVYGLVFTLVVFVGSGAVSLALGVGWFGVELVLFFLGVSLLAYAAFQLRPAKRWDVEFEEDGYRIVRPEEGGRVVGSREESQFQATVQRVPPLPTLGLEPEARLSPAAKLFVAAAMLLLASLVLEIVVFW